MFCLCMYSFAAIKLRSVLSVTAHQRMLIFSACVRHTVQ
uniref:Uncharacterized protein n=1 Tax=Anguilla anguilla TaxID=7936 RepID=A0A0E9SA32_ANGAN